MKRLIPTDKEWFNYKKNKHCSVLFAFITYSATFYNGKLYYPKEKYIRDIELLKKVTGLKNKKSIHTYKNKLIDLGYITEDKKNFYPINRIDTTYILIDKVLLYNLCTTESKLSVPIFVYLMDKMNMKQKVYKENTYNFTIKELKEMLGYSTLSQNKTIESKITDCLKELQSKEYIKYNKVFVESEKSAKGNYKIPNYLLTYVFENKKEQPQEIITYEKKESGFVF